MIAGRRRLSPVLALSLLAALAVLDPPEAAAPPETAPPGTAHRLPLDPSWSADPVWDDGLAEVSVYDAERVIYGAARPHALTMVVVKEDFDDARHVKADPPYEGRTLTPVLKLNLVSTVATENYPYNFLTSLFVRRDDPRRLVKATFASQEWCGNTFKEIVTWDGPPSLRFHSYFDGEGDGALPLPIGDDGLLDEQLLVALRAMAPTDGRAVTIPVLDPLVGNRVGQPGVSETRIDSGPIEIVAGPAGEFRCRRLDLIRGSGRASYWIQIDGPRALVKMESIDGRKMMLRERSRRDYWSR